MHLVVNRCTSWCYFYLASLSTHFAVHRVLKSSSRETNLCQYFTYAPAIICNGLQCFFVVVDYSMGANCTESSGTQQVIIPQDVYGF